MDVGQLCERKLQLRGIEVVSSVWNCSCVELMLQLC
uniref:Uncharacterized protein n=1 Tax=Ipomoea trifida TaxID=35884 RepID=A0A901_IPOTF|nr:hypothetical protein [Ipomoea trifida]